MGIKQDTRTLASVLTEQQHDYSSFAGRVLAAHVFHRTIQHTSRGLRQQGHDADTKSGPYWTQHRNIDNNLVIMMMFLPHNLKLPRAFRCQNAIFVNLTINTATICLHRAAIWKCQQLMLPEASAMQYKARLLPAAQEIATILRLSLDLQALLQNPLILLSVYIAALVFLDDTIADQAAHESKTNLDLMLHIMLNGGDSNPVAGSIAVALASEMERGEIHSSAMEKVHTGDLQDMRQNLQETTVQALSDPDLDKIALSQDTTTTFSNFEQQGPCFVAQDFSRPILDQYAANVSESDWLGYRLNRHSRDGSTAPKHMHWGARVL